MAIGEMWNTSNPKRIWAWWDPDDDLFIPFGIEDMLVDMGCGYGSHDIVVSAPFECPAEGTYTPGQRIRFRIKLVTSPTYNAATYYPFTFRLSGDDGTSRKDVTLYLRVRDGLSDPAADT